MKNILKNKVTIVNFIETLVCIFLVIGINFWFHACMKKDDGTYMNCHNAEVIIKGLSIVLLLMAVAKIFLPNLTKLGLAISSTLTSLFMTLVPNTLISLCMMDSMRCHKFMKPYTIVFGIVLISIFPAMAFPASM